MNTFEYLGSYCLTEADSGSDAFSMKTTATEDSNGDFILNGTKRFISGAGVSDIYIVFAKTGVKEVSAFIVYNETPGKIIFLILIF